MPVVVKTPAISRGRFSTCPALPVVAAILAGLLTALPWLDERAFPAAWLGMTLWIAVTAGQPPHRAFRLWFVGGIVTLAVWLHWFPVVAASRLEVSLATGTLVTGLAVTWDAFRFATFGYLVAAIRPRATWGTLAWPVLWVALEWVWPHLFPWRIGQSQLGWLALCQVAEFTGVYGVSFLFMWGAAVAGQLLRSWFGRAAPVPRRALAWQGLACCAVLAASLAFGTFRMHQVEADGAFRPQLRMLLVQAGECDEAMLARLRQMSRSGRTSGVDLVVWGESTVGDFPLGWSSFRCALDSEGLDESHESRPCPELGCPLLCAGGSFAQATGKNVALYNTAFLIDADETILSRYHKRVLMPWGEYAVGQQYLPALRGLLCREETMLPGDSAAPLALSREARLGVLICYEDMLPQPARESALAGASVLVNLNNLSSFGRTCAPFQHLQLAKFRAIENRRWLVRCGTTGSTAVITATGRVDSQLATHVPASHLATVLLVDTLTCYTRWGDVFAAGCLAASALLACRLLISSRLPIKNRSARFGEK